jgi:ferrous iron transport protein B
LSTKDPVIALVGNPNTGKSTLFNALTGLRQHVGNYPGVTVERKEGTCKTAKRSYEIIDLPGTYALNPKSPDERITYNTLLGVQEGELLPDAVVMVVDAGNLERNMYILTQLFDLKLPVIVALNMVDVAQSKGITIDTRLLSDRLGVPVVSIVANKGHGIDDLKLRFDEFESMRVPRPIFDGNEVVHKAAALISEKWVSAHTPIKASSRITESFRLLNNLGIINEFDSHPGRELLRGVLAEARAMVSQSGANSTTAEILARYAWIGRVCDGVVHRRHEDRTVTDKVDTVVTHKIWGPLVLMLILLLMFQSIFTWAEPFMDLIDGFFIGIGSYLGDMMPDAWYTRLLTEGVLAGLGGVVIFLPQIMILFMFISVLEGSGYMARAAFVMDGFMTRIGLNGRSVAPLISGFACAIPGIMATRTIENTKDRLITIMVLPFMACSARLPVYALMTAAFVPNTYVFGFLSWQGITFFGLYFFGIVTAITAAWVFKKVFKGGESIPFLMELPDYKVPDYKLVMRTMVQRGWIFVVEAGKVIMVISIVLWFLASYPVQEQVQEQVQVQEQQQVQVEVGSGLADVGTSIVVSPLEMSYAGRFGKFIEPAIEPLGFDWKIGIALLTSFAAREVLVGTLNTIYSVEDDDDLSTLRQKLADDTDPVTGKRVYGLWTAISLMVFFALACQCMSTLAVVRRETNGWKWPVVMFTYMTALAWLASLVVYQLGTHFFPGL